MALSSDDAVALVGAPGTTVNGNFRAGEAYFFTKSDGSWSQLQAVPDPGSHANDFFGQSIALSADGNVAVMGVPQAEVAYVFTRSGSTWSQVQAIPDPAAGGDNFGGSVALSSDGSVALISAGATTVAGNGAAGEVYFFSRSGNSWRQLQAVPDPAARQDDGFGGAVALSADGSVALISAVGTYYGADHAGEVYFFTQSGGTWLQAQAIPDPAAATSDLFGWSVALSSDGGVALIATGNERDGGVGLTYFYTGSGGNWSQAQAVSNPGGFAECGPVALSSDGSIALIGACSTAVGGNPDAGEAYFFTGSGGTWSQAQALPDPLAGSSDQFGRSVALSSDGSVALVGAPGTTVAGQFAAGQAYFFTGSGGSWTQAQAVPDPGVGQPPAPALSVAKAADISPVTAGQSIGFTIDVSNIGDADAAGVTVSDTMPTNSGLNWSVAGVSPLGAGSPTPSHCTINSGALQCDPVPSLPAGDGFEIHVTSPTTDATASVDAGSGRGVVSNHATAAASNADSAGPANAHVQVYGPPPCSDAHNIGPPPPAPNATVAVRAVEVSQSVQDWCNSVDLIAGKATIVRVHLETTGGQQAITTGANLVLTPIAGNPNRRPQTLTPRNYGQTVVTTPDAESQRSDIDSTLNFLLPTTWEQGTVQISVTGTTAALACVDPTSLPSACGTVVSFQPSPTLRVTLVPVRYRDTNNRTFQPSSSELNETAARLLDVYPVARISYSNDSTPISLSGNLNYLGDAQRDFIMSSLSHRAQRQNRIYFGVVEGSAVTWCGVNGGRCVPFGTTCANCGVTQGYAAQGPGDCCGYAVFWGPNTAPLSDEWTAARNEAAHEIAHALGLGHPQTGGLGIGADGQSYSGYCADPPAAPNQGEVNPEADPVRVDRGIYFPYTNPQGTVFPYPGALTYDQAYPYGYGYSIGPTNPDANSEVWGLDVRRFSANPSSPDQYHTVINPTHTFSMMSRCLGVESRNGSSEFQWVAGQDYESLITLLHQRFG